MNQTNRDRMGAMSRDGCQAMTHFSQPQIVCDSKLVCSVSSMSSCMISNLFSLRSHLLSTNVLHYIQRKAGQLSTGERPNRRRRANRASLRFCFDQIKLVTEVGKKSKNIQIIDE
jgi:hypothetical protein